MINAVRLSLSCESRLRDKRTDGTVCLPHPFFGESPVTVRPGGAQYRPLLSPSFLTLAAVAQAAEADK